MLLHNLALELELYCSLTSLAKDKRLSHVEVHFAVAIERRCIWPLIRQLSGVAPRLAGRTHRVDVEFAFDMCRGLV